MRFLRLYTSDIEAVFLKLDFEKAFDSINWDFLFELLLARGFGQCWIGWIKVCLLSRTSSILINGKPGNYIQCRKGLRQGDPLSPYLFILVADTLTHILSLADNNGCIQNVGSFPWPNGMGSLHYADDTPLLVSRDARFLLSLKLLYEFEMMTGLKINFHKSLVYNLRVSEEVGTRGTSIFICNLGSLPFTCPRLPIKSTSLTRED